jgi:16S rRNA (guanine1207-N2)-methyltransferase
MTVAAFRYTLKSVAAPQGRALWLYGGPEIASGDVYHPWQNHTSYNKGSVFSDIETIGYDYDAVFVNCPKQREESEGLLALALDRSRGFVMAAAANDAGGGRLQSMMEAYGIRPGTISKSKARVVWTMHAREAKREIVEQNLAHLAFTQLPMEGKNWWTVPGLFGWNKVDPGSRLLLESLPVLSGKVADFGCGFGYLAVTLETRYPALAIDAYDIDARAVKACARNGRKVNAIWQDIRSFEPKSLYDAIVMNPPFHSGREENMALGQTFIAKAWESLKSGGKLFLVANRHLPYEKTLHELSLLKQEGGYKIMTGKKA